MFVFLNLALTPKILLLSSNLSFLLKMCTFQLKEGSRVKQEKNDLYTAMQQMSKPSLLDFTWCHFIKIPKSAGIKLMAGKEIQG